MIYLNRIYTTAVIFGFCLGQGLVQTVVIYALLDMLGTGKAFDNVIITIAYFLIVPACLFSSMSLLGIFGQIYATSNRVSLKLQNNLQLFRNKYFRRFYRSCPTLRVNLGATNFVEMKTSANLEQIVLQQTVELQLLKSKFY